MPLLLGSVFPEFSAETNAGQISSFHEWIGNSWAILFSHPNDFTPVCTTELARAAQLNEEFKKRDVKLIALSCDSAESHRQWIPDIVEYCKQNKAAKGCGDGDEETKCCSAGFPFPIIADEDRVLANKLEMLDPEEKDASGAPVTARAVFVIDPSKRMKLKILYPATTGRNFDEILRVVDSLQLTAAKKVATPVDWQKGDKCMVIPTLNEEEAVDDMPLIKRLEKRAQLCFDEKNYYEALQVYLTIYPRLKKQKKYDALVDCLFKGVMKFFKVDEFASGLHLADFIVEVLAISDETLTRFEKRHGSIKSLLPTGTVCKSDIKTVLKWNRVLGATKVHPIPATELEIELD